MQHWWFTWISWNVIGVFELFFFGLSRILLKACFSEPFLFLFEVLQPVNFIFFPDVFRSDVDARLLHRVFRQALEIFIPVPKLSWNFLSNRWLLNNSWLICSVCCVLVWWLILVSLSGICGALLTGFYSLCEQVAIFRGDVHRTEALSGLELSLLGSHSWWIWIWARIIYVFNNWHFLFVFINSVFVLFCFVD